jgi:hypothetical protein
MAGDDGRMQLYGTQMGCANHKWVVQNLARFADAPPCGY